MGGQEKQEINCRVPLPRSIFHQRGDRKIAGSSDTRWRRPGWQHHASVFSPVINLSMSSDVTPSLLSEIHPSSLQNTHTHTRRLENEHNKEVEQRALQSKEAEGEMEGGGE